MWGKPHAFGATALREKGHRSTGDAGHAAPWGGPLCTAGGTEVLVTWGTQPRRGARCTRPPAGGSRRAPPSPRPPPARGCWVQHTPGQSTKKLWRKRRFRSEQQQEPGLPKIFTERITLGQKGEWHAVCVCVCGGVTHVAGGTASQTHLDSRHHARHPGWCVRVSGSHRRVTAKAFEGRASREDTAGHQGSLKTRAT